MMMDLGLPARAARGAAGWDYAAVPVLPLRLSADGKP